jgi:hypothetical protein
MGEPVGRMTSSEYYKNMIEIEKEKLDLMREDMKLKKWYAEEKLSLLREKLNSSHHGIAAPPSPIFTPLQPADISIYNRRGHAERPDATASSTRWDKL